MLKEPDVRIFEDTHGWRYHVRITPRERVGGRGVDARRNVLVFETEEGRWVGSVPIYHNVTLKSLSDREQLDLLDQAIGSR